MKLIKQPADSYLCQACCAAMLAGTSLEVVLQKAKLHKAPDGSGKLYLSNRETIRFLLEYWLTLGGCLHFKFENLEFDKGLLSGNGIDLVPGLLGVRSKLSPEFNHAVVWDPELRMILDPHEDEPKPLEDYEVYEWWPVTRIDQDHL